MGKAAKTLARILRGTSGENIGFDELMTDDLRYEIIL